MIEKYSHGYSRLPFQFGYDGPSAFARWSSTALGFHSSMGNHSKKSVREAPHSRFANRCPTGTLVSTNTHAPLILLGIRSTAGQSSQPILAHEGIVLSCLKIPTA